MTNWAQWFHTQLQASADGFAWAAEQLSPDQQFVLPPEPGYLGTWEPGRHVWHVAEYERCLVIPTMRQWLGGEQPYEDAWPDDDVSWELARSQPISHFLDAFRVVRQEQLQLLEQLAAADWVTPRATLWGPKPLSWIVTKTFQHTYEHGDTLLRMGLWWQHIAAQNAAYRAAQQASGV